MLLLLLVACTEPTGPRALPNFTISSTPTILAAGDIASCGTANKDEATGDLVRSLETDQTTVMPLGDLVYPSASLTTWNCYAASWGSFKAKSRTVAGNHDIGSDSARSYVAYWGEQAGPAGKFYYSFDIGAWHIVVLNDAETKIVSTRPGTPQDQWLVADLQNNTKPCLLAAFHEPRWRSNTRDTLPLTPDNFTSYPWNRLYQAGADLILNASVHDYTRFLPARPDGTPDESGIPQYTVGTGGASQGADKWVHSLVAYRAPNPTFGVLEVRLLSGGYETDFRSTRGETLDPVARSCHRAPAPAIIDSTPLPPVDSTPPPDTTVAPPPDTTVTPPADSTVVPPVDSTPPPVDTVPPVDTTPPPPPPPSITLTVSGRVDATKTYAALDWKGAIGPSVTVFRNGALQQITENDGHYTNSRSRSFAPITYTYQVCAGVCSNPASVSF